MYGTYIPSCPKLYVSHPAQVIDNAIADSKDAMSTNIAPLLCHRINNVNPMQFNREDAEHTLAAYTPYTSDVMNNNAIPVIKMTMLTTSTDFTNEE